MELVEQGSVARYFQVIADGIGSVGVVRCLEDKERKTAASWEALTDTNISFFIVPEADGTVPNLWLAGDRHLATNRVPLQPGLFTMPSFPSLRWADNLSVWQQNLCYADGHVATPTSAELQASAVHAVVAYQKAATNTSFRLAIP